MTARRFCDGFQREKKAMMESRNFASPSSPWAHVSILLALVFFATCALAEIAPVGTETRATKAWVGERVPFFVELRAKGSFSGTPGFDLPQLGGTLLMKIGSPIVGSREIEGESWFTQTHEFALFSQKSGTLEVPSFNVRFRSRDGFTGPEKDTQAKAPGFKIEIQRPAGSNPSGFLITTESLDITEKWEPEPASAGVGAIFKRAITQRAPQVPGMALAPASDRAPDGIRVYRGDPTTSDKLERGDFLGERGETITYLMRAPGTFALPALTYTWWNPKSETLESKTLPTVTIEITAPPAASVSTKSATDELWWLWLIAAASVIALLVWKRQALVAACVRLRQRINPPHRIAAREFLRACQDNDPTAANRAWIEWSNTRAAAFEPTSELRVALLEMQRATFGPSTNNGWRGDSLARIFRTQLAAENCRTRTQPGSDLPLLNA